MAIAECNLTVDRFPPPAGPLFGGERMVPNDSDYEREYMEHLHRYLFAGEYAPDRSVLDIGCGTGYGADHLSTVARSVLGVDCSPEAIEFCTAHYSRPNLEFRQANVTHENTGLPKSQVIVCFEVLEHVQDPRALLSGIGKAMTTDGVALVSTPNVLVTQYASPFHCKEYTAAEFQELCRSYFGSVELFGQDYSLEFRRLHTLWEHSRRLEKRVQELERLTERPWFNLLKHLIPEGIRARTRESRRNGAPRGAANPSDGATLGTLYGQMRPSDLVLQRDNLETAKTFVAVLKDPLV